MARFNPRKLTDNLETVAGVRELVRIVKNLNESGRKIIIQSISGNLTQAGKQQFLTNIRSLASSADQDIRNWLLSAVSKTYVSGINQTNANVADEISKRRFTIPVGKNLAVKKITVGMITSSASLVQHKEAVNVLLSSAYSDFANSITGYVRGAERIIDSALKQQIRSKIAVGALEGDSIRAVKKTIVQEFADSGFTVLLDKRGRKWSLSNYSEMLARTHILKANNEGVINRASDFEIDIVQVFEPSPQDDLCLSYADKLFSISGKSDNYPMLEATPPFHPNCRGSLIMRPDLN